MSKRFSRKDRRLFAISPWIVLMLPIHVFFVGCGVLLLMGYGGDGANRVFGAALLALSLPVAVFDLSMRVVIADPSGVRALFRCRLRWVDVQFADVIEFTPGILPNMTVRLVGKKVDPKTGNLREYLLAGLAGFDSGKRHQRIVARFNDWIAQADPDWVINPWLHSSDRPDNR